MEKHVITTKEIGGTFSTTTAHGTKAGGFVFVTGQVANKPGSDPVTRSDEVGEMGGLEEQTIQTLDNIQAILRAAGSSFEHVVKRNVYITHHGDFEPIFKVMERYFTTKTASTTVLTGLIPPSARVEIDVIAVMPSEDEVRSK